MLHMKMARASLHYRLMMIRRHAPLRVSRKPVTGGMSFTATQTSL